MFGNIGTQEIILILLVVLLLFGAKRLPELGQSMGKGIREFKRGMSELGDEFDKEDEKRGEKTGDKGA